MEDEVKLPEWMSSALTVVIENGIQVNKNGTSAIKNNLPSRCEPSPSIKRTNSSSNLLNLPAEKKLRLDDISDRLNFCDVASECEQLLNTASVSKEPVILGLDLNWPTSTNFVAKSYKIHVCYGEDRCLFFEVEGLKKLPLVFHELISHPNVKLIGHNIIRDLLKLGKDFNFDSKPILGTSLLLPTDTNRALFCKHNWSCRLVERNSNSQVDESSHCINELDCVARFKGEIKYTTRFQECAAFSEQLLARVDECDQLVLGFDLEWPARFKKGSGKVALIQICPDEDVCFIFHVYALRFLPKVLVLLLNHSKVRLSGLNIANDIRKLSRDFNVDFSPALNNIIELSTFANEKLRCQERWSLAGLVANQLQVGLDKGPVRISNWANQDLSSEQLLYAATDAYVSLLCYLKLELHEDD